MEKYDYRLAIKADIITWLNENEIKLTEENFDEIYEKMRIDDQVTGNASGSYTFNTWQAEEYICHNWDLIEEVCEEFGLEPNLNKGAKYWDVSIRCYLLNKCMIELIEENEKED